MGIANRTIPVLRSWHRVEDCPICEGCWRLLAVGFRQTTHDSALEPSLDGPDVRLTEPQLRSLIALGLQADGNMSVIPTPPREPERQLIVRGELRRIDADLQDAVAASVHGEWAAALQAVRMLGGRAVITRRALEGMLGANVAADLPPLVRAVQGVKRVISDREVDSLAPDVLRARMHAVLRVLDRELQAFLDPPQETPVSPERVSHAFADGQSGPERP
jgi:hypothetical protein